ncbi:serine hydrolase domain-containing protein [Aestuariivirga sp.]|uniref:serine hydrolase domain-containing protein n=1 Tax=Aestuariivirga sp. TaxID=2650926 RepID=UPI003BA9F7A0
MIQPNPDLAVGARRLASWNTPARRRESFRSLHMIHRRGLSFRAPLVLPLRHDEDPVLASLPGISALMSDPAFCTLVIVQDGRIVLERHAADFAADRLHSIQSVTKSFVHLALGRLIAEGKIDPLHPIADYVPAPGDAYARASVQQALDMNVPSNFEEDYAAPYSPPPANGAPVGYARQEIAMGWRLPPADEAEFGVRSFAAGLVAGPAGNDNVTRYASPNTDMLGWIIEQASGRPLSSHVEGIVAAAGLESSFHISADCDGVPVLSGGGVMTARDLARYGLLIARGGAGVDGSEVGSAPFLADAMSGAGTSYGGSPQLRYRNHLMSNGTWAGHPGFAGQFLMVDPAKRAAAAFFSVLETEFGDRDGYFAAIISALSAALQRLD